MENGNQWVGMKECNSDTVAMPPIVDKSSAVILNFPASIADSPLFSSNLLADPIIRESIKYSGYWFRSGASNYKFIHFI